MTQWRIKQDYHLRCHKNQSQTHTGAGWLLCTLTILWKELCVLWKTQNEAVHGHNITSQQQAQQQKQHLKMIFIHSLQDQVLAGDTDIFVSNNPAALDHFLDTKTATYVQNWLHVWKPFILSSVKSANKLALQGV
jgi:hypothetical protein